MCVRCLSFLINLCHQQESGCVALQVVTSFYKTNAVTEEGCSSVDWATRSWPTAWLTRLQQQLQSYSQNLSMYVCLSPSFWSMKPKSQCSCLNSKGCCRCVTHPCGEEEKKPQKVKKILSSNGTAQHNLQISAVCIFQTVKDRQLSTRKWWKKWKDLNFQLLSR